MIKRIIDSLPEKYHGRAWIWLLVILALIIIGIGSRIYKYIDLHNEAGQQAVPIVAVIEAKAAKETEEIILPGNVQAWHEATVFARTNGYVSEWLVDIGARVKEGDLLATIEIPEVEKQLRQAEADLLNAIANYNLAQTTANRWRKLLQTNSVSKQDADEKISNEIALKEVVKSTRANRDRLKELVGFRRVVAPFDGIITDRITDIGSLINEGSTSVNLPMFHIVQANRLRVYIRIPQNYATRISADVETFLKFAEHPGKKYPATLLQTAKAIDPTSRTLLAEFSVENSNYELFSGGYTQAHLRIPAFKQSVILPVNTLIFRAQGLQVATLGPQNKAQFKSIRIARDFGTTVEITSGINIGEKIIINPPDSLIDGQTVRLSTKKTTKKKGNNHS